MKEHIDVSIYAMEYGMPCIDTYPFSGPRRTKVPTSGKHAVLDLARMSEIGFKAGQHDEGHP